MALIAGNLLDLRLFDSNYNYFNTVEKKKIIKKYEFLTAELISVIKETYPDGFEDELITIPLPSGGLALALPLETEDASYLIKMPDNSLPDDSEDYDTNSTSTSEFDNFESLDAAENIADEE